MTLLLVRHASTGTSGRLLAGRMPGIHLNSTGREQARSLVEPVAAWRPAVVYSSPAERAVETAKALESGLSVPLRIAPELAEIDYGEWTGQTFENLAGQSHWTEFNASQSTVRCPGGEMMIEVQARVIAFIESLMRQHAPDTMIMVSHAGVIRAAICHFAGIPLDHAIRLEISLASVSVLKLGAGEPVILALNQTFGAAEDRHGLPAGDTPPDTR